MRNLDAAVLAELSKDHQHIAIIGEFDFLSGVQNLWAGPEGYILDYDSKQWIALGEIGQIDKIGESQGLTDSRTIISMRLDSENVDVVDVEDSRGRIATLTVLFLSDEGVPVGPIDFRSTMGAVSIRATVQIDNNGRKIVNEQMSLELLNETASLNQTYFVRNTYESGQRIDSTDHGLEFVSDPEMQNTGMTSTSAPGSPGGAPRDEGEIHLR